MPSYYATPVRGYEPGFSFYLFFFSLSFIFFFLFLFLLFRPAGMVTEASMPPLSAIVLEGISRDSQPLQHELKAARNVSDRAQYPFCADNDDRRGR